MYQIDFQKPSHLHFIGIGGISMSGLAEVLLEEGFAVSGSDVRESDLTKRLAAHGAKISYPQSADNITDDISAVICSAAIHPDNPEYAAAQAAGIPILTRAQLLGQLMEHYDTSIAVSGTHGKTTTTSMISHILMEAGTDPTISVGGILPLIDGNIRVGGTKMFLTEACEYTNSFLSLYPKIGVILNIDADHLDFFKDLDDIRHSFHVFASQIKEGGTLIINGDIPDLHEITDGLSCRIITFSGTGNADFSASDISYNKRGCATFACSAFGEPSGRFTLQVPGAHNVANALAAIAVAYSVGIDEETIQRGFASFHGTDRRFQLKGKLNGADVIDDYAHHPTEIRATLSTAENYPHKKLWCVFQPHTYTRTKALLPQFADVLSGADHVILADIYAARETDTLGISSKTLQKEIQKRGTVCDYFPTFEEIESYLRRNVQEGDLVLTVGAGDIVQVSDALTADNA